MLLYREYFTTNCLKYIPKNIKIHRIFVFRTAILLLKLRKCMWEVVDFFVENIGVNETTVKYKIMESFHEELLRVLSGLLHTAGVEIDYTKGGKRKNCDN